MTYYDYDAKYGSGLKLNEDEFYDFFRRYMETTMTTKKNVAKNILEAYGCVLDDGKDIEDTIDELLDQIYDFDEISFIWSADMNPDVSHERFFDVAVASLNNSNGALFKPYYANNKPNIYFTDKEEKTQNPDYVGLISLKDETSYVFYSDHKLDSVDIFERRPYNSYQEFRQEFQDKMAAYLPDDFDWDVHIGIFNYVHYQ